jgi:hypothetical protein
MSARKRRGRLRSTLDELECRELLTTLQVTTTADSGKGSLRDDVGQAAAGDMITFADKPEGQTITLTSGPITPGVDLTIAGPGSCDLTVSGGGTQRIFIVPAGVSATIRGLTIADGKAAEGAGVDDSGILTLDDDLFTRDVAVAPSGGTGYGGAVFNESGGTLTVTGSAFCDNQAQVGSGNGGAGGAIEDQARERPHGPRPAPPEAAAPVGHSARPRRSGPGVRGIMHARPQGARPASVSPLAWRNFLHIWDTQVSW